MSLRRYGSWSSLDKKIIGMDFSAILPPGVGIAYPGVDFSQQGSGGTHLNLPNPRLEIWTNFAQPVPSPEDWYVDPSLSPTDAQLATVGVGPGPWYWVLANAPAVPGGPDVLNWEWATFPPPDLPPISDGVANYPGVIGALPLGTAVQGRMVYSIVSGGDPGQDYQFRWFITDTLGNRWTRTGLLLVGQTS